MIHSVHKVRGGEAATAGVLNTADDVCICSDEHWTAQDTWKQKENSEALSVWQKGCTKKGSVLTCSCEPFYQRMSQLARSNESDTHPVWWCGFLVL